MIARNRGLIPEFEKKFEVCKKKGLTCRPIDLWMRFAAADCETADFLAEV